MVELYNDKNSVTSEQIEEAHKMEIDMPGIDPKLKEDLESRILEFEEKHEWDALHGKDGWVKRIAKKDVLTGLAIVIICAVWWAAEILGA